MSNWVFVGAAFGVTWAVILGYLIHLMRATRRSREALERATMAGIP